MIIHDQENAAEESKEDVMMFSFEELVLGRRARANKLLVQFLPTLHVHPPHRRKTLELVPKSSQSLLVALVEACLSPHKKQQHEKVRCPYRRDGKLIDICAWFVCEDSCDVCLKHYEKFKCSSL
jgi:hypothetical protein